LCVYEHPPQTLFLFPSEDEGVPVGSATNVAIAPTREVTHLIQARVFPPRLVAGGGKRSSIGKTALQVFPIPVL